MYSNQVTKYIRFDDGLSDYCVLFPNFIQHANIALNFSHKPISAGFFAIDDNRVIVYGKSISLNLQSDEEDAILIQKMLFGVKS